MLPVGASLDESDVTDPRRGVLGLATGFPDEGADCVDVFSPGLASVNACPCSLGVEPSVPPVRGVVPPLVVESSVGPAAAVFPLLPPPDWMGRGGSAADEGTCLRSMFELDPVRIGGAGLAPLSSLVSPPVDLAWIGDTDVSNGG